MGFEGRHIDGVLVVARQVSNWRYLEVKVLFAPNPTLLYQNILRHNIINKQSYQSLSIM